MQKNRFFGLLGGLRNDEKRRRRPSLSSATQNLESRRVLSVELISVNPGGFAGNGLSSRPSASADGRYVVFESAASDLVPGDSNGTGDVFLRDRVTGATVLVSRASADASISGDGRYVVFSSAADDLVVGDTNGVSDIFLRDLQTGTTTLVSQGMEGAPANHFSSEPSVSADGRYVVFYSFASNLVADDTNSSHDVFVRDTVSGTTARINVGPGGVQADGSTAFPAISPDGRFAAYYSAASNLIAGGSSAKTALYVRNLDTGINQRISLGGENVGFFSSLLATPSMSWGGRYVAFQSLADDVVAGDSNTSYDIFVADLQENITRRVSTGPGNVEANHSSQFPSLSWNGQFVAFQSQATNLVPGDTSAASNLFVRDLITGVNRQLDVNESGAQSDGFAGHASLSGDGRLIAFTNTDEELVANDTNNVDDVYAVSNPLALNYRRLVVSTTADTGPGSLRQAILDANSSDSDVRILFQIPATDPGAADVDSGLAGGDSTPDVFRIVPNSALPNVQNALGHVIVINAQSQADLSGNTNPFGPEIVLDGTSAGNVSGFSLRGPSEIRGFTIQNFSVHGISAIGNDIVIAGNSIGILADGQTAAGNLFSGIAVEQSQNVTIGGFTPADRNVISGNGSAIRLSRTQMASITNNYVGTDITGNLPVPNGRNGHHSTAVQVVDSSNVIVGAPGAGNVVSASVGSFARGIELLNSQQITVQANRIGTNAAGNQNLGNGHSGLYLRNTTDVLIGGVASDQGNVISGNARSGIELEATSNITIQANRIGTNADGKLAIPNFDGISITNSSQILIGGSAAPAGNLISANEEDGIELFGFLHNSNQSTQITIRNNRIGTDSAGNGTLGNGGRGIRVTRTNDIQISDNVISDSGNDGIRIEGHDEDFRVFEWPVSAGGNGHFYTLLRPMSWSDAEAAAAGLGGHLVSITSAEESAFIASVFRSSTFAHRNDRLFIGLSDTAADGTFSWATGEPLSYTNWSANEPNGGINENHAELLTDNTWNDANGDLNHLYGLVEFTSAPDSALLAALQDPGTIIQRVTGNKIGVAADGSTLSGNASDGIEIVFGSARRNIVIGGNLPGEANIIAGNTQDGITINSTASGAVVSVTGNSIYGNGDLGIDLGSNGVTSNDVGDADTGVNGLQNFPVLSIDNSVGLSRMVGRLDSTPDTTFSIEIFLDNVAAATVAEGRTRLFTTTVTTDSSGQAQFIVPRQPAGTTGFLTATATRITGETSEFSPAVPVLAEGPGIVLESDGQLVDLASLFSFGATQTGTSRSRTFVVRNTGTTNLILQPVTAPAGFSVTSNFGVNQIVPAGGTVSIVVRFDAITNGSAVRTLTINNNVSPISLNIGATADHRLRLVADFVPGPGSSTPRQFAGIGNQLIFRTFRDDVGIELFRTDGTTAGTTLLADINPGTAASTPSGMHSNGTLAAFRANDGIHGNELWVTDGTPGGTRMTSDLNPGAVSGATSEIFVAGDGSVYFTGNDGTTGLELFRYNPATGTTSQVSDITPGAEGSFPSDFVEYNGRLYFNASNGPDDSELWVTDGTSAGTGRVIDLAPGSEGSYAYPLGVANGLLFFVAEDASHGGELWSTDGTTVGTRLVRDIRPGASGSFPDFIGVLGSRIFFAADNGMQGAELWSSDGTESGTILVKDINPGAEDGPTIGGLATIGNRLYFHATTSGAGTEIWSTDGTSVGTTQLLDLFPGTTGLANSVFSLGAVGDQLFFGGSDGTTGQELWVLDVNQTPAAPEIEVTLNGANIQDDTGRAEYGTVPVGSTPVSQTFTVRNTGQSVLNLGTVTVPAGFQITNPLVASLAPGASDVLVIRMNTTTTGLKTGVVTFSTNDNDENPFNFTIAGTVSSQNLPPIIGSFDTPVSYIENGVPVVMDTNATVTDADSLNLATGKLIVTVAENMQLTDRVGIRHQGTGPGQIGVSGLNVTYGGVLIGTFAGTTTLTVTLNDAATPVAVQAMLRNVTFSSLSENPSILPRMVRVTLTDGDGGTSLPVTKTVNVVALNDAPVVSGVTGSVSYTENAVPTQIAAAAVVSDVDSANLQNGRLTVSLVTNAQSTDRIGIRHQGAGVGQIGVSGLNVSYGGVLIGTFAGTTTLTVTLNDAATPVAVQAMLRNVTFSSLSENPSILPRMVRVTLTDGDGGTSLAASRTINVVSVNDAPSIGSWDSTTTYTENAIPNVIDLNVTVSDPDSLNLSAGKLIVSVVTNVQLTDRIGIRHQGAGVGQIGVSGLNVSFSGIVIGTFSGTSTLTITLNNAATPLAVQALLRNITFFSLSENPSALPRTVRVTLTDGDGGTSLPVTKTVNVIPVNDAPVIGPLAVGQTFVPGGSAVSFATAATVTDVDSANFDTGRLTVRIASNAQASDLLSITHQGTTAGKIGLTSSFGITSGGTLIGTYSGGAGTTALVVTFNSSATPAAVQALIRSLTYRSTLSTASTAPRTISLSLTDGDGGTSSLVTTTLNVATPAARIAVAPPSSAIDRLFGSTSLSDELLAI